MSQEQPPPWFQPPHSRIISSPSKPCSLLPPPPEIIIKTIEKVDLGIFFSPKGTHFMSHKIPLKYDDVIQLFIFTLKTL